MTDNINTESKLDSIKVDRCQITSQNGMEELLNFIIKYSDKEYGDTTESLFNTDSKKKDLLGALSYLKREFVGILTNDILTTITKIIGTTSLDLVYLSKI